jgi:exosortase/archaeosortase family protein
MADACGQTMPPASPEPSGGADGLDGKAVRGFILRFGIFSFALALVPLIPGWDGVMSRYLSGVAVLVNGLLHLLGQPTQLDGTNVFSSAFHMAIEPHCSALDIVLFYSATVLAFPAAAMRKTVGLLAGFIAIATLNIIRITTVYLTGIRWPANVQGVHEKLWPVFLIMGTVALCAAWVCYARKGRAA